MEDQETAANYRDRGTREELNQLLRHGHGIPVSKRLTDAYVREHYPGWTWNELVDVVKSAGVVVLQGGGPPKCDDRVEVLYFNGRDSWLVVWVDGSVTTSR